MNVRNFKEESGTALVMVLLFVGSLFILGGALSTITLSESIIARNQEAEWKLYYITEAGIETGVAAVSRCFQYSGNIIAEVGEGSIEVVIRGNNVEPGHKHYEKIGHLQIDPVTQRLIISCGRLNGKEMAMAAIVERHPLSDKALAVASKLTIEECVINGNLHVNEEFHIREDNFVNGELTCSSLDKVHWEEGTISTVTVKKKKYPDIPGDDQYFIKTYSKDSPFTDDMYSPEILVPPVNINNFLDEASYIYPSDQTWSGTPADYSDIRTIFIQGGLSIMPDAGQAIELSDKVIMVQGDLTIEVPEGAVVNLINCLFLVNGRIEASGWINRGIADPGNNMVLFVSNGHIDLSGVNTAEGNVFLGSRVLLFSKNNIEIGGPVFQNELEVYGAIIARQVYLHKCRLHYVPDIFEEYNEMLALGVVIKEWLEPWKL